MPTWYSTGAIARLSALPTPSESRNSPIWTFSTSTSTASTVCRPDQPGIMPIHVPSTTDRNTSGGATFPRNTANNLLTKPRKKHTHYSC